MTCEEWRNGYKQGFEDGYEKAKRDISQSPMRNPVFPAATSHCNVCGMTNNMTGVMSYVCMHDNCPNNIRYEYTYKPTNISPSSFYDNGHEGETGC